MGTLPSGSEPRVRERYCNWSLGWLDPDNRRSEVHQVGMGLGRWELLGQKGRKTFRRAPVARTTESVRRARDFAAQDASCRMQHCFPLSHAAMQPLSQLPDNSCQTSPAMAATKGDRSPMGTHALPIANLHGGQVTSEMAAGVGLCIIRAWLSDAF